MGTLDVTLTDLVFPAALEDKFCKFRPLISIRYRDSGNKVLFAREALPGLGKGDYWECEKGNKKRPNYVRDEAGHKVDMNKIDVSKRQLTFSDIDPNSLELIMIEIYDVDVSGFWDKLRKELIKILPELAIPFIPANVPVTLTLIKTAIEHGTGKKVADLEKGVIDKAMGKEDNAARSIWVHSSPLKNLPKQSLTITGGGVQGDYSVAVEIEKS